jgi:outer membrane protein assembly factor BamA
VKQLCTIFYLAVLLIYGRTLQGQQPSPRTAPETQQILSSYEGQNVTAIEIAGRPDLDVSRFTPYFVQKAGQPFSRAKVDATIAALKRKGKFTHVQLEVNPEAQGVRVLLVLQPAVYFGIFEFPGAEKFPYSRLIQVTNYPPGAPYNADDIHRDQANLTKFFQQEGYFEVQVRPEVKVDRAHGLANVVFHTDLHRQAKFGKLEFAGATPEQSRQLTQDLQSFLARLRGDAVRQGKTYSHKTLNKASQYLQKKLEAKGYLAARVSVAGAEYIAARNQADVEFKVDTGAPVHVRIEGAHLWSWDKKSLLPIYQGVGVDSELVQEGNLALVSYYQKQGYFDAKVSSDIRKKASGDVITYKVVKGKKHKVEAVSLTGNRKIASSKLTPLITVKKAQFFSRGQFSQNLVRDSSKNLKAAYQSNGFSDAKVTSQVTENAGNVRVAFHVVEGPQDTVAALKIVGADKLPESEFAPKGLKLTVGGPYSQQLIQDDRKNILARYLTLGFLTANLRETATSVSSKEPHRVIVTYHIYEGPQVFTNEVITLGRQHTQPKLIHEDVAALLPGKPLAETQLLNSETQLYNNPGVFDWAEVDPKRKITTQTKEDVLVKVHEAKRNEIHYGFGFEIINRGGSIPSGTVALPNLPPVGLPSNFTTNQKTYYGPRGTFEYTRNNVRGKGESLSLTAFAGRLDQRGAAYYINPNLFWSKWTSTLSLTVSHDGENPVFSSQEEIASYQLQRDVNKANTNILFLRYSFNKTDLTRIEIPELVPPKDRHIILSTVSSTFTRDTRDNILDAHRGVLQTAELDFNSTKLGSSVDFAKLTAQAAAYKRIPHNIIWANSIRIGLAEPFANSFVPLSEEFFTGGGSTLRGFPLDSAGPQRQVQVCSSGSSTNCTFIQVPTGGNELLILNTELRIPFPPPIKKGLGMAIFYDGGNVFPVVGFHDFTSLYSNNVGAGLRYATPVGPIRIDLGRNLNPISGIPATQYFISIGQAF